jgi:predicted nucleic acid-binding protein
LQALDLEERHQLSFWDALISAAAISSGASMLYSDDLCHGQLFGDVRIADPFV